VPLPVQHLTPISSPRSGEEAERPRRGERPSHTIPTMNNPASGQWETGDWDWDPANDPHWDNPAIPRRRIDPGEIPALANAIVRGASLTHCIIPDLRALIDAVQAHPDAKLARAEEDADGFLRRTGVFDRSGNEVEGDPTSVNLRGCVVESCDLSDLDSGVTLEARCRFAGDARFAGARFAEDALFVNLRVAQRARLTFERVRFEKSVAFDEATIRGRVFFTNATLDERLTFHGADFGSKAGLGFNRFLARGGATVELARDHIEPDRRPPPDRVGLGGRRPRPLWWRAWRGLRPVRLWLGQCRPHSIIQGADAPDSPAAQEMSRAAHDYELLAAVYRNQPATDREEDVCRWRAHELRRRARAAERLQQLSWGAPLASIGRALRWLVLDVLGRWLLFRMCIGYLLQPHRLMVTGLAIILGFALVYWLFIGIDDISHGGFTPRRIADVGWDYPDAYRYWKKDAMNPLYLSLTTFVTLGYGDFQPAAGWLKLVTAIEGICGVTLLALFTVAWGRKMVR